MSALETIHSVNSETKWSHIYPDGFELSSIGARGEASAWQRITRARSATMVPIITCIHWLYYERGPPVPSWTPICLDLVVTGRIDVEWPNSQERASDKKNVMVATFIDTPDIKFLKYWRKIKSHNLWFKTNILDFISVQTVFVLKLCWHGV